MANEIKRSTSPTLMSVAHAGGQGKTTVAQLLHIAAKRVGAPYRLFSADFMDEGGHSRLGKLYDGDVTELGAGAELTASRQQNNPNAAVRYWDRIGPVLLEGGAIIDVGANVIQSIVEWGVDRRLENVMAKLHAPRIDLFCVCKSHKHAYDDISSLITKIVQHRPFQFGRVFVVQNEIGGAFDSAFKAGLETQFPDMGLIFLRLPGCHAEIWAAMERKGVSIEKVLESDIDELMTLLDVDLWTASSGLAEVQAWVDIAAKQMRDHDVFSRREARLQAVRAAS